jgi:3-oxoacyl-[acyl-carrier protein] reductase
VDLGLDSKVAFVAGGSKGIGRAIALELAREGARVAIAARTEKDLAATLDEVRTTGAQAYAVRADLTSPEQVTDSIGRVVEQFGELDILVNNVGDSIMGHDWKTGDQEWSTMIETCLLSAVRCSRAAIPHLLKNSGGRIINIASVNGHQPPAGRVDYNATKAAMIAMSKTLSNELAPQVTVNTVCPARIETPLWHRMAAGMVPEQGDDVAAVLKQVAKRDVPMGRFGRPDEVAALVAFLASERAAWITGVAYNIDGGYTRSML